MAAFTPGINRGIFVVTLCGQLRIAGGVVFKAPVPEWEISSKQNHAKTLYYREQICSPYILPFVL
jgi:hypothetical protein